MRRTILAALVAFLPVVPGLGCRHRQTRPACDTCSPGVLPRSGGTLGEPLPPVRRLPPSDVPVDPFPPALPPDSRNYRAPDPNRLPPADIPLSLGQSAPRPDMRNTANGLGAPLPPAGLNLPTPSNPAAPNGSLPPRRQRAAKPMPESLPRATVRQPFRTPIPGRDGVTSGGVVPAGGYERLRDDGVRTVVYVHDPAISPSELADARAAATAAGLNFAPIAVSPDNLPDALTPFARAITDATAKPVHVIDPSGVRAGSLWYLIFRTVEQRSDEVARLRATPLGLPDPTTAEGQRYWPGIRAALR